MLTVLDHRQTHIAGRTPLNELSARRHLTHNKHKRRILVLPAGFEPAFPATMRLQTYALEGRHQDGLNIAHSLLQIQADFTPRNISQLSSVVSVACIMNSLELCCRRFKLGFVTVRRVPVGKIRQNKPWKCICII